MATDAEAARLTALARAYGLEPSTPGTWLERQLGGVMPSTRPRGSSGRGLSPAERAKMEWEATKRQWAIEDRIYKQAAEQAQAEAERQAAAEERQRAYETNKALAELIASQGAEAYQSDIGRIAQMYGPQAERIGQGREAELGALTRAVEAGRGAIGEAEQQYLQSLMPAEAYSEVPLVDLQDPENVLLRGLLAEGASTAGVESQRAQDEQLRRQLAAMQRSAGQQMNVSARNYLQALRQAGMGAAAAGRQQLALSQPMLEQSIRQRYGDLESQLLQSRLEAEGRAEDARRQMALRQAEYEQAAKAAGYTPPSSSGSSGASEGTTRVPQMPTYEPEMPRFVDVSRGVTGEAERAAMEAGRITRDEMEELIRRRTGL